MSTPRDADDDLDSMVAEFTHTLDNESYEAFKTADEREYEVRLKEAMSRSVEQGTTRRDKEGWLWKQGHTSQEWKRYYFNVSGNICKFYKNENKSDTQGSFSLEHILCVKVSALKNKRSYCFVVCVEDKGMLYVAGHSFDDMLDWMLCFTRSDKLLTKLMDDAQMTYLRKLERENSELAKENSLKKEEIRELASNFKESDVKRINAEQEAGKLQEASKKKEMVIDRLKSRHEEQAMVNAQSKTCAIS